MSTNMSWSSALALCATILVGCSEAAPSPATTGAQAAAADLAAPVRVAPSAATTPCAVPEQAAAPTPAPAPAAPPATVAGAVAKPAARRAAVIDASSKLRVKRLVVADRVTNREPVGAKALFRAADAERIYAFVEVENASGEQAEITVAFEPPGGGAAKGNVSLAVGASPRWRTWAFTRAARSAGVWTAVVRAPGGDVLARTPFEITL